MLADRKGQDYFPLPGLPGEEGGPHLCAVRDEQTVQPAATAGFVGVPMFALVSRRRGGYLYGHRGQAMSKQYSIAQARDHLPSIVHDAEKGSPVELTRRGKPVAVLLSIADYQRLARGRPDLWQLLQAFRERNDLEAMDVDEIFGDVRDRSPGREVTW